MWSMRACFISIALLWAFIGCIPQLIAGQNESVIVVAKAPALTIVAVDGRRLKDAQQQISVTPGRHRIVVRITDVRQTSSLGELPFEDNLQANHRYTIDAQVSTWGGGLKFHVDDKKLR